MWTDQANGVSWVMVDNQARVAGLARQQGDPVAAVAAIVGVALVMGVVCALVARFHLSEHGSPVPQSPRTYEDSSPRPSLERFA